jgi:hypothetical protein
VFDRASKASGVLMLELIAIAIAFVAGWALGVCLMGGR